MPDQQEAPRYKVAALIDDYNLTGVGAELEQRWTRQEDRDSLRDLAEFFNQKLLRQALRASGVSTLPGEVANLYRLLTAEDVTAGNRKQVRGYLRGAGVDVDRLTQHFVSYQAIRTYLLESRDVTPPSDNVSDRTRLATERTNIQRLQRHLRTVATGSIDDLARAGELELGEHDVMVNVEVHCRDCGTHLPVSELFDRNGCRCEDRGGERRRS